MDKEKRVTFNNFRYFILILFIIFLSFFSFLYTIEKKVVTVKNNKLETQEKNIVDLEQRLLGNELDAILSDLLYLSKKFDSGDNGQYDMIAEEWRLFSETRKVYDQIRFIDVSGNEKIRVNFSLDMAEIVEKNQLQNKSDRYYFYESIGIGHDQIYISRLDLNVDNCIIQEPKEPVIRFSKPIFDDLNHVLGVIILNYKADFLIEDFKKISNSSNGEIYLLNSSGYWLSSNDSSQEWGFMYDELQDVTFQSIYSYEWNQMTGNEGSLMTENGLFTYGDVVFSMNLDVNDNLIQSENIVLGDGNWKIVSYIPMNGPMKDVVNTDNIYIALRLLKSNLINFSLIVLVSIIVSILIIRNRHSTLQLKYFSEYDSLTNVLNRRAGLIALMNSLPHNNNNVYKLNLCFLDINGLKQVNDNLGHDTGDELIKTVSKVFKESIDGVDYVIRLGGDEFLIVFINKELEESELIWSNIKEKFDYVNQTENRKYLVSVSHGIVEYKKIYKDFIDEFVKTADEKMYLEKKEIKSSIQIIRDYKSKKL